MDFELWDEYCACMNPKRSDFGVDIPCFSQFSPEEEAEIAEIQAAIDAEEFAELRRSRRDTRFWNEDGAGPWNSAEWDR